MGDRVNEILMKAKKTTQRGQGTGLLPDIRRNSLAVPDNSSYMVESTLSKNHSQQSLNQAKKSTFSKASRHLLQEKKNPYELDASFLDPEAYAAKVFETYDYKAPRRRDSKIRANRASISSLSMSSIPITEEQKRMQEKITQYFKKQKEKELRKARKSMQAGTDLQNVSSHI